MLAADSPSIALNGWVLWAATVGSLCTAGLAMAGFWRKVLHPMLKVGAVIEENFPVWVAIASRYGEEGHETITAELQALSANDAIAAANSKAMLARLDSVSSKVELIDVKLTATRHDIIGDIAALSAVDAGATTLVEQMERTSRDLQEVRQKLAELTPKETE